VSERLRAIPVFPLPGVVLFPRTVLALHVFEPRYRQMVREAQAGPGEIAMALLRPGYEEDYKGSPPVFDVGCAGRMRNVKPLPDGRFLLELAGGVRVRFEAWDRLEPYRIALCREIPEKEPDESLPATRETRLQLAATFEALRHEIKGVAGPLSVDESAGFAETVNRICFALDLDAATKLKLLLEDDLELRGRIVGGYLEAIFRALAKRDPEGPPRYVH
jgi:Lon protease-like protein